jgi:hypothetical protein
MEDNIMNKDAVLEALSMASKGLLFPSETDAPLEPFAWGDGGPMTAERLCKLAHCAAGTAIEENTLADLFRTVPREDQARFQTLRKALENNLSAITVYKVGDEAEKAVYIVGNTVDGHWAGLKTTVVET